MAFILNNFYPVSSFLAPTTGNSWLYKTNDTKDTVLTSGYFDLLTKVISINDLVILNCNDGLFLVRITTGKYVAPVSSEEYKTNSLPISGSLIDITVGAELTLFPGNTYYCHGIHDSIVMHLPSSPSRGAQYHIINNVDPDPIPVIGRIIIVQDSPGMTIINGSQSTTAGNAGYVVSAKQGTCFTITYIGNNTYYLDRSVAAIYDYPTTDVQFF